MKWRFCQIGERDFYFGEVLNRKIRTGIVTAHGIGIYFENWEQYFFGQWDNGNLIKIFVKNETNCRKPQGNLNGSQMKIIYRNFRVFTEYYELAWDDERNDLFHNEKIINLDQYSVKKYEIFDMRLIYKVLRSIHYMFYFRKNGFAIYTHFMLVNFNIDHLEFQLVTNKVFDPRYAINSLTDVSRRMKAYSGIIEFLKQMHSKNICHDDIDTSSVRATFNQSGELILSFYDFSRAREFNEMEVKDGYKINSLFTRSTSFRAPETFKNPVYNAKTSDCYSLALILYAFEMEIYDYGETGFEGLAKQISDSISRKIDPNVEVLSIFREKNINRVLDVKPNQRIGIDMFSEKATTT
jgi:serine/threonine protein kinase